MEITDKKFGCCLTHRIPGISNVLYWDILRFVWKEKLVKNGQRGRTIFDLEDERAEVVSRFGGHGDLPAQFVVGLGRGLTFWREMTARYRTNYDYLSPFKWQGLPEREIRSM